MQGVACKSHTNAIASCCTAPFVGLSSQAEHPWFAPYRKAAEVGALLVKKTKEVIGTFSPRGYQWQPSYCGAVEQDGELRPSTHGETRAGWKENRMAPGDDGHEARLAASASGSVS